MKVHQSRQDGVLQIRLEDGDALDAHSAPRVKQEALSQLDETTDVILDLSNVEFVDSAGVGVLVSLFRSTRELGRRMVIASARPGVMMVMEIIKLDRIFELHPDVASAERALAGPEPS